jgi:hypothetical protein
MLGVRAESAKGKGCVSEPTRQSDPYWMLPASISDWQRMLDSLCALRLGLAGLALRHAADPDGGRVDEALNSDIATVQAQLQEQIERVRETLHWLRELERTIARQAGTATGEQGKETLH